MSLEYILENTVFSKANCKVKKSMSLKFNALEILIVIYSNLIFLPQ